MLGLRYPGANGLARLIPLKIIAPILFVLIIVVHSFPLNYSSLRILIHQISDNYILHCSSSPIMPSKKGPATKRTCVTPKATASGSISKRHNRPIQPPHVSVLPILQSEESIPKASTLTRRLARHPRLHCQVLNRYQKADPEAWFHPDPKIPLSSTPGKIHHIS